LTALAGKIEGVERERETHVAALTAQIEQHKLQIDRLMQHIEDIAHQRFDESMATLAMTRELEAGAARIADLERTLANRDVSLLQRDAEMKLLFRAVKTLKPDTVSRIQRGINRAPAGLAHHAAPTGAAAVQGP